MVVGWLVDGRTTLFGIGGTEGTTGIAGDARGGAAGHGGRHGPANSSRMSFRISSSLIKVSLMK